MLPQGHKVGGPLSKPGSSGTRPFTRATPPTAVRPGGIKSVAASAASSAAAGAKAVGKQVASGAAYAKGAVVSAAKSTPAAAKNAVAHPQAAARSAGQFVKTAVKDNTVGLPSKAKERGVGVAAVGAAMLGAGAAVPVAAINGAAAARPRPKAVDVTKPR